MDRATDFESVGWGFESLRVRQFTRVKSAYLSGRCVFSGAVRCSSVQFGAVLGMLVRGYLAIFITFNVLLRKFSDIHFDWND